MNLNSVPSGFLIVSVAGLKSKLPANANTVAASGCHKGICYLITIITFCKIRLNEVILSLVHLDHISVFGRCHHPIHGPHEFDKTIAPTLSNVSCIPSLDIVALNCSDPVIP